MKTVLYRYKDTNFKFKAQNANTYFDKRKCYDYKLSLPLTDILFLIASHYTYNQMKKITNLIIPYFDTRLLKYTRYQ